jgi:phosphate transport system substrate-binding protein
MILDSSALREELSVRVCSGWRIGAFLALSAMLLAGCSAPSSEPASAPGKPVIRVAGSGPHLALLETLTEMYPYSDEVTFQWLPDTHSAGAIQGVTEGAIDIGGMSGGLTNGQAAQGIAYHPLSRDALVLAIHPSVTVTSLTSSQVRDIYAGRITDWGELGGNEVPIVVLDRDESSSAKKAFRKFVLADTVVTSNTVPLFYEEDMLAGLDGTPGAIAYLSLGGFLRSGSPAGLVELDGVKPSAETVDNGEYAPLRELGMVTRSNAPAPVRRFVEWAKSPQAVEELKKKGYAAFDVAADR